MSIVSVPRSHDGPNSLLGKREQKKRVHRQAILEAGEHVLGADLRRCVAVDRIAARAGLAKGTVYNYFGDKAELVEAVTRRVEARVVERIDQAMWSLPTAGARVAAAICAVFETAAQFPEEAVILERRIGAVGGHESLIGGVFLMEIANREFDRMGEAGARRAALALILGAISFGLREAACSRTRWGAAETEALIARCLVALGVGEERSAREARIAFSCLDGSTSVNDFVGGAEAGRR